jgi:hypothetical protein
MPTVGIEPQNTLRYYPQEVPAVHPPLRACFFEGLLLVDPLQHDNLCAVAILYEWSMNGVDG